MKNKYIVLLIASIAVKLDSYAQNYAIDALRYSQYQFGSTARVKALGNSQTAMGGDVSSIGGNPAGLGLFTKSEFSFTPEILNYSSESSYLNQSSNANRGRIGINNLGVVFAVKLNKPKGQNLDKGAISLNFGIGYNKTADFGNKLAFNGINSSNSISDFYADVANNSTGTTLEPGSIADAAYDSNLINYSNQTYTSVTNANPTQNEIIIKKGSQSEFNFAAGLNISNKLYLGTSIGILGMNYSSDNTFTENGTLSYSDSKGNYQENYANNYYQRFEAKGTGFNAKLGLIFRPNQYIRLGANVQSPNWYNIDDTYSESLRTRLTNNPFFKDSEIKSETKFYDLTYNLRTPAKYSLGAALLQSKLGFITADVEFVDYSSIELSESGYDNSDTFIEDNRYIINNYVNTVNYKIGAEIKATSQFMIRGGYSVAGSPIENTDQNQDLKMYTFGAGYRARNLSIDVAFQNSLNNISTSPYKLDSGVYPTALSKTTRNGLFITVATRF